MSDQVDDQIKCPKCGSPKWSCWDERTRDCWDSDGNYAGVRVIGGLKCGDCNFAWLDYSSDPCIDEPDCECEDWD